MSASNPIIVMRSILGSQDGPFVNGVTIVEFSLLLDQLESDLATRDAEIAQLRNDVDRLTLLYSTSQAVMKSQLERIQSLEHSLDSSRQRVQELEADVETLKYQM